jgi:hypothetical protein
MAVGAIVAAAATIGGTIAGVVDGNKRRKYEQNLMFLNAEQQKALNSALVEQKTEEGRQRVLAETLGTLNQSRIAAMVQVEQEREKTRRYTLIGVGTGLIVLVGVLVFVTKKNRG